MMGMYREAVRNKFREVGNIMRKQTRTIRPQTNYGYGKQSTTL